MARVVCFGELMLRLAAPGRELLLQTPRLEVSVAGAEANVAVALAHLGHEAAMVSLLPDGRLGDAALAHLRGHGVASDGVGRRAGRMGLYFLEQGAGHRPSAITYDRADSVFARATAADFDWPRLLAGADLLHLSGINPALGAEPAAVALAAARAARSAGVTVSFDGNYRGQLWRRWCDDPAPHLRALIAEADILFGNHRDLALALGTAFDGDDADRRRAADAAFTAFPRLSVIASTLRVADAADENRLGARLDRRDGTMVEPAVTIGGIVDRIGAGDAFAAGILHGLLSQADDAATLRDGLAMAVLAHSVPGDAAPFTTADLAAFWNGERDVRR